MRRAIVVVLVALPALGVAQDAQLPLKEGSLRFAVPMLWATGVGSEFMRPMAAPILGGILVADEVIDIFIPVLFYFHSSSAALASHDQQLFRLRLLFSEEKERHGRWW